jgi:hypothetical protein
VKGFGKELSTCAVGKGIVVVEAWCDGGTRELYNLTNCLHIPSAQYSLISQSQLDKAGISANIGNGKICIHKGGKAILHGALGENDMYKLNMLPSLPSKQPIPMKTN